MTTDELERECLDAAVAIVRQQLHLDENLEPDHVVRVTLHAIKAVGEVLTKRANDVGDDAAVYVDRAHIVGTAFWIVSGGMDDDDMTECEIHPYAAGGLVFVGFAGAIRLLEALSQLDLVRDEPTELSTCGVEEALTHVTGRQ
jgi:hypothetical protein